MLHITWLQSSLQLALVAINKVILLVMKHLASGAIPPVVVNTRGTNYPFSNCSTRFMYIVLVLFLLLVQSVELWHGLSLIYASDLGLKM